jgi:hypothetical protein
MTKFRISIEEQVHEVEDDSETDAISKAVAELKYTVEEVVEDDAAAT